mgnify:CR=1 FL=1
MNKPVVNGKASICQWELELLFRSRKQVNDLINLLTKEDVDFEFCLEKELDETSELYILTVVGRWANNLVTVSRLVEQVDYSLDLEDAYEN